MRFHALGSFAVVEQSERRSPPLRPVLLLGITAPSHELGRNDIR
jgi:hypothetical protein